MGILKLINGKKTYFGTVAAAILYAVVEWSPDDALTWEHKGVVLAISAIGAWTGVAVRHAMNKR